MTTELVFHSHKLQSHMRRIKKWKKSPKPDSIIYIKTPVDICCSRKDDIPDPYYLEIREPLYDDIAKYFKDIIISGNQDKHKMLDEVMDNINKILNS